MICDSRVCQSIGFYALMFSPLLPFSTVVPSLILNYTQEQSGFKQQFDEKNGNMESSNVWKVADPIQVPIRPITRARAKKFKEALNGLIYEIWNQVNLCKPIDQGPRQPQTCINLIQLLEESTNLA